MADPQIQQLLQAFGQLTGAAGNARASLTGASAAMARLRDQMQRAAVSVCSNVAEGDERDTDKDAVRFFYIAKGSIAELITQLEIAKDARLIEPMLADRLIKEAEEIGAMLGALIKARA